MFSAFAIRYNCGVKCPQCGSITSWDTLQCPCGHDAERPIHTAPVPAGARVRSTPLRCTILKIVLGLVWSTVVIVLTVTATGLLASFTLGSLHPPTGDVRRITFLLLAVPPLVGLFFVAGGIWLILDWS
ncbi:MAG: hypothetical protein JWP63_6648 [Candidatus Solibacter sp.]|nr:hypothetical protein [Candidatus Solibacter sp.]